MKSIAYLLLSLAIVTGCANKDFFGEPKSRYHTLLKSRTRDATFFGLEKVKYLTHITYRDRALREAYVEEYARLYKIPADEKTKMLATELAEADKYDVFLICHYATDSSAAKITPDAKQWRVTLRSQADGPSEAPESISEQSSKDPLTQYFYPYVIKWSKNYLVKFPRHPDAGALHLEMNGVLAQLAFDWVPETATP